VDLILGSEGVPKCPKCGGVIKPDVVLYEEGLNDKVLYGAVDRIREADLLIVGGTSLVVYPAAGLINYYQGNRLVLINLQPTGMDSRADLVIQGKIGEVLGQIQVR
jgi:NAD-dependent deacetylase